MGFIEQMLGMETTPTPTPYRRNLSGMGPRGGGPDPAEVQRSKWVQNAGKAVHDALMMDKAQMYELEQSERNSQKLMAGGQYAQAMHQFANKDRFDATLPELLGAGTIKRVGGKLADKLTGPVPGVPVGDELIGVHNLRPEALAHADKMGGLPVPSIAVTKTGAPMEGFGDITLIAGDSLTTPKAGNPMFASDAYTPRYPTVDTKFSSKDSNKISEFFAEPFGKKHSWEAPKDSRGHHYAYGGDLDGELSNYGLKGMENHDLAKARYLHEKGKMPDVNDYNTEANGSLQWRREVNNLIEQDRDGFKEWVGELPERIGVEPKEKIFRGYDNNGNRKYAPHNMKNVVRQMKGNLRDGESMNYGLGSLRSNVTPKFRNKSAIKDKRDLVVSKADMETSKESLNDEFFKLAETLNGYDKQPSGYGYDVIQARLAEIPRYGTRSTLNEYYDNVPDSLVKKVDKFLKKLSEAPTEYFEGKPQRAVGLGEFKGAMVPEGSPSYVDEILAKSGISNVVKYADPKDRAKIIRNFEKEMFSFPAALGAGYLGYQGMEE